MSYIANTAVAKLLKTYSSVVPPNRAGSATPVPLDGAGHTYIPSPIKGEGEGWGEVFTTPIPTFPRQGGRVREGKRTSVIYLCSLTFSLVAVGIMEATSAFERGNTFQVPVNKSRIIALPRETTRISVGNTAVADIRLLDPTHLYVLGMSLGTTNVTLGSKTNPVTDTIDVEVTHDLDGLKAKLHELFPNEHPKVYSSQGSIVLAGEVSSLEKMDAILAIARTFVHRGAGPPSASAGSTLLTAMQGAEPGGGPQPGSSPGAPQGQETGVINLLQVGGPQQVMLEVTVAEMNRTLARNLNVDFTALSPTRNWSGGAVKGTANVPLPNIDSKGNPVAVSETTTSDIFKSLLSVAPGVIDPSGLFARFISPDFQFKAVINAAKEHGLAKILAEPTLTTISGQEAQFLAGGEFPIPVPQTGIAGAGAITIEFKEFGAGVKFLPVVLDSGRISLKLNISVSELTNANAVTAGVTNTNQVFVIPALTKRSANSSVELTDGQTIGIAGLISDNLREAINKFPGLGQIPILGQLFTSQEFLKNQTELVIFVTPRLARPIPPELVRLPTDSFVEPSDVEYYWMGRTEGRAPSGSQSRGGLHGHFGQQL